MTWLARHTQAPMDDSSVSLAYAADFATVMERAFPIDDAVVDNLRSRILDAFIQTVPEPSRRRVLRPARRAFALALAATLGVATFGAVAVEANPGGPFYPIRLAIERNTLPALDTPTGWAARIERLHQRITEMVAAEHDQDASAISLAVGEYRSELAGLVGESADPGRRSQLTAAASHDLEVVVGVARNYPSEGTSLLMRDILSIIGPTQSEDGIDDPHPGAAGDPSGTGDATGAPSADREGDRPGTDRATGDPHPDATTGDPHSAGTTGNPHASTIMTGDPHPDATTGDPHSAGTTGNPHAPTNKTGKPHGGGTTGNPNPAGSGKAKRSA